MPFRGRVPPTAPWMRPPSRNQPYVGDLSFVMPGLVPGIHALLFCDKVRRGWPDKPGHDGENKRDPTFRSLRQVTHVDVFAEIGLVLLEASLDLHLLHLLQRLRVDARARVAIVFLHGE